MKVLIIDDEEVSLFITQSLLVLEGLSETKDIQTFLSANDAIIYLSQCSDIDLPDLILLDINMPHMDGWQFLDALAPTWSRFKETCKIYILTSSLAMSDTKKAKVNPMICGYVGKFFTRERLKDLLS